MEADQLRGTYVDPRRSTYAHLFPDSEDLGRGAVDDALASARAEQERNASAL
ncbi:MAG TPA: hypothetical protein VGQ26_23930 [Streptosporangiaceae bacterium]|jgi:hypothetical protein|nr:hypothetical protein [Streptosporangiaceae bacterium]